MSLRILSPIASAATAAFTALALSACGAANHGTSNTNRSATTDTAILPGANRPPVTIGDKNFTEQFVLGELYRQALEAQGFNASINRNIGITQIEALETGRLDMYPEYLGTWNTTIAADQQQFRTVRDAYDAGQLYAQGRGLVLLQRTPFSDVDSIGVTVGYAAQNGLRTIGDLVKVAPALTLGAPPQFKTTGLLRIEQVYGVLPTAFKAIDVGEQYAALDGGSVQAVDVSTTDGQLSSGQYTVLSDPKRAFGWGNVVPVVPSKVLVAEGPAFASTINAVSALLNTDTMRNLNADVDIYHQDPAAVAKQFLQAHGLFPLDAQNG